MTTLHGVFESSKKLKQTQTEIQQTLSNCHSIPKKGKHHTTIAQNPLQKKFFDFSIADARVSTVNSKTATSLKDDVRWNERASEFLASVRRGVAIAEKDIDVELSSKSEMVGGSTSYRDFYVTAVYKQMLVKPVADLKGNYCWIAENASWPVFGRNSWMRRCWGERLGF